MNTEKSRDLESEREELIQIMIKNIPDKVYRLIQIIEASNKTIESQHMFSISTEGTNHAK